MAIPPKKGERRPRLKGGGVAGCGGVLISSLRTKEGETLGKSAAFVTKDHFGPSRGSYGSSLIGNDRKRYSAKG